MTTRIRGAAISLTATALLLAGCGTSATGIQAVGTVKDQTRTVQVPALLAPTVNIDAGFAPVGGTSSQPSNPSAPQTSATQRVVAVLVTEGATVRAGQTVAELDPAALRAQRAVALADRAVAEAQPDVLSAAIDTTYDGERTINTNRDKVNTAIATLTKTLNSVRQAAPKLKQARTELATKLAAAEHLLAHYPPVPVPGVPPIDQLRGTIAALKAAIKTVDTNLASLATAEPKLTSGLAKARAGLAKLNTAAATVRDARQQLRDLRNLARIAADTAALPVALAEVELRLATVTAPCDGVVTWTASVGDQLSTGAPVVSVRQIAPTLVTAWLPPDQAAAICPHDPATVRGDWFADQPPLTATISHIWPTAEFPPSSTATDRTHLTRAVHVELSVDGNLPAGVPVEISITGCRSAASPTQQDR